MITVGRNTGKQPFYNMGYYICDTEDDVADLPTNKSAGSTATVVATGNTYMLNSSHVWVLQPQSGGSSDGNLPDSGTTIRYDGGDLD